MLNVFFDQINSVPLQNTELPFELKSWLANLVDSLNEIVITLNNTYGIAASAQTATSAQITTAIAMNATPVLGVGTIWYDTTLNKLKVLTTAAVPGVSNGVTQTVTSV